jgi:hypothetical protein
MNLIGVETWIDCAIWLLRRCIEGMVDLPSGMSQAIRQPRQNTKLPPRTKSQRISLMYQANQRNLGEHIWITTGK